jgi:hypothetical protein
MILSEISATSSGAAAPAASVQPASSNHHELSFHDILSALNPIQYLPVVGTIYRAATGDVIPEALRVGGSLLVSGLLSGPIGLMVNIAVTMAEKATGIDPEKIVADQFQSSKAADVAAAAPDVAEPDPLPFSPQQLAAYGIHLNNPGSLDAGEVDAADTLNMMELVRLHNAAAAYVGRIITVPNAGSGWKMTEAG